MAEPRRGGGSSGRGSGGRVGSLASLQRAPPAMNAAGSGEGAAAGRQAGNAGANSGEGLRRWM